MDAHDAPDKLLSEPPPQFVSHDNPGSMNLGAAPPSEDAPAVNGDAASSAPPPKQHGDPYLEQVNRVLNSDVSLDEDPIGAKS
jgi:hypothetical protein